MSIKTVNIVLFTVMLLLTSTCCQELHAAWSQFQGNAQHTGYVSMSGVPQQSVPNWTAETVPFMDPTPAVRFTPGIASDGDSVFISWVGSPSTINGVSALNIQTGVEKWEWIFQGNDAETISAPAYDSGRIYVHRWGHSSSCGIGCHDKPRLLGIDASNGQQIFDQTHSGQWSSGGRPTAINGEAYVAGGYYGGLDNYNGQTGAIEWFANMPQRYGWIPAADDQHVYTSFSGNLTMVDIATGNSVATLLAPNGGGFGASTPTVVNRNEVYVPIGSLVTQFDPANRFATWDYQGSTGSANHGIAVDDEAVFLAFTNSLDVVDRQTGQLLWRWASPTALTNNVVLTDTHVFVSGNNNTYGISLNTQAMDWTAPFGGSLAAVENHLFISDSNALRAFAVIPEPNSAMLLAFAAIAFPAVRLRRHK